MMEIKFLDVMRGSRTAPPSREAPVMKMPLRREGGGRKGGGR